MRKLKFATARNLTAPRISATVSLAVLAVVVMTGSGLFAWFLEASGDQLLPQRSIQLFSSVAGANTTYKVSFVIASPGTLGSIKAEFCSNDPLVDDPCTVPSGLDVSAATLTSQTGETGFSVASGTTANTLILSRTPAAASAQPVSYTLGNIVNPSAVGSYYVRLQTFASADATGARTDHGGLAFAINNNLSITSKVPPYLLFCSGITITNFDCNTATGSYINFGNFSTAATSSAQTQLVIATNAGNGYDISYQGSTLTSGNNTIPGMASNDVSRPGVSQFGINLVGNQDPVVGQDPQGTVVGGPAANYNQPNRYRFVPNETMAINMTTSDYKKYTVSYIANIAKDQAAGVYVSTLTYVAAANF